MSTMSDKYNWVGEWGLQFCPILFTIKLLSMSAIKELLYAFTCLSFAIVIGAAVYEHIAVVPRWSAAPPASLTMFQGEYGLNAAPFWKLIHPVTLLLMITTLVIFWKTGSRIHILVPLSVYVAILAVTAVFFVPELLSITQTPLSDIADAMLTKRAQTWETMSIVRLGVLVGLAIYLFLGLGKAAYWVRESVQTL